MQVNRSVFIPNGHTNPLTVFIAWLNLDLGIETCFYIQWDECLWENMATVCVSFLYLGVVRPHYFPEQPLHGGNKVTWFQSCI